MDLSGVLAWNDPDPDFYTQHHIPVSRVAAQSLETGCYPDPLSDDDLLAATC